MFLSVDALVVKLTDERTDHTIKCLLGGILEVEVEVKKGVRRVHNIKMVNNSGAENRLATSGNAI